MKKILITVLILVACMQLNERSNAQTTNPNNTSTFLNPEFNGWNLGAAKPYDLVNAHPNQPMNFYTNAVAWPWVNQKMQITATGVPLTEGFVGIGCAAPLGTTIFGPAFPAHRLDVDLGDINVNQPKNGYRIGGGSALVPSDFVLWHNGNISNIYVGVGAGLYDIGSANTFVGNNDLNS